MDTVEHKAEQHVEEIDVEQQLQLQDAGRGLDLMVVTASSICCFIYRR